MQNQSRRRFAKYIADQLASGQSSKSVAKVLAAYLVENKQTRLADLLLRDIETAMLRDHSHLVADVVSARKLSHETQAELIKMLKRETDAKTVELLETVDENLVGGLIVHTPDSEMDSSVKNNLAKLRAI